jgi:thiol-disulfide isomerase/thioredoxin
VRYDEEPEVSQRKAGRTRQVERAVSAPGDRTSRRRSLALLTVVGVGVAAVIGVGVLAARNTGPAQAVVNRSGTAVSFSGEDPVTGSAVSTSDFVGTPLVVNVWGSWCPGCIDEAEDLRVFVERHPEVQMIGVDLQDTKSRARAFYEDWSWTHPSVFDPDGSISFSLGLQGTPTTFFLDAEHRVVTTIIGATDLAGFERALEQALATDA